MQRFSARDVSGILIAGGYGVVGRRVAMELAADFPNRVILAGRVGARASAAATAIGYGARGRAIDVTVPSSIASALDGAAAVVSCIDQPGRRLLDATIERGLLYTDITPHLIAFGRGEAYEKIHAAAQRSGARLILGTGIPLGASRPHTSAGRRARRRRRCALAVERRSRRARRLDAGARCTPGTFLLAPGGSRVGYSAL